MYYYIKFVLYYTDANRTHAVVRFLDEGSICCVPMSRITFGESLQPELSEIYPVKWTNRKSYQAEIIAIGTASIHYITLRACVRIRFIIIYNYT